MILLWFMLGIALAFGIARYNESNRLFWQLLLALVIGFTGTIVYKRTFGKEQSNVNLTQVCPTQECVNVASVRLFQTTYNSTPVKVTASNPVSQDYTPELRETHITLSEVYGGARDQPPSKLIKPPT